MAKRARELFWWLHPEERGAGGWLLRRAEKWALAYGAASLQMIAPPTILASARCMRGSVISGGNQFSEEAASMSAPTTAAIIGLAASSGAGPPAVRFRHQAGRRWMRKPRPATRRSSPWQAQAQAQQNMAPYQAGGPDDARPPGQMAAQPAAQFNPNNYSGGALLRQAPKLPQMPSQQMPGQAPLVPARRAMPGQQPGGQGDTVTIQTPDGRAAGFPRARLQEAMQRGAKVIG